MDSDGIIVDSVALFWIHQKMWYYCGLIKRYGIIVDSSKDMVSVCEISSRPIDNVYVKSSWSMSNFHNFVYNVVRSM